MFAPAPAIMYTFGRIRRTSRSPCALTSATAVIVAIDSAANLIRPASMADSMYDVALGRLLGLRPVFVEEQDAACRAAGNDRSGGLECGGRCRPARENPADGRHQTHQ